MSKIHDFIVVGSGCSGAIVAQRLISEGNQVLMVDAGITPKTPQNQIPNKDFLTLRKTDPSQSSYFIGENASSVKWGDVGKAEQVTPPREHIYSSVDELLHLRSRTFDPLESLAYGGLGAGWGLQCWKYSDDELRTAGLPVDKMHDAYEQVSKIIGISATKDAAHEYTINGLRNYMPSPEMDRNHKRIQATYNRKKRAMLRKGLILGRTPLALITHNLPGRKKYAYRDMDFYSDNERSAWRPWMLVDELRKKRTFSYAGDMLVLEFKEYKEYTEISCMNILTKEHVRFKCRKLILASGTLGSARIILRSRKDFSTRLPILCNDYKYVPCIQPRFLGAGTEKRKLGFTQLSLFLDEDRMNNNSSVASLYSYQSLMLFRIVRNLPLGFHEARSALQFLLPAMVIMGIHHPDSLSKSKYLRLQKDIDSPTGDILTASFEYTKAERTEHRRREKKLLSGMRKLGVFGMKIIDPGAGASIHYAGTIPFEDSSRRHYLHSDGKLHGTRSVYVADSSGFRHLPSKGLTFSLMANAYIIAGNASKNA